ncbi:MAG: hypothetical protein JNK07_15680 [Alphaproteobacteria bacterium]|nr:hypothetical protein [Alphaproteobacteria bacterium]
MRKFAAIPSAILFSIALSAPAVAEGAPDLAPLTCAWDKLPPDEQTRLRDEFKVDIKDGGFTLHFAAPTAPAAAGEAARACQLNLAPPQLEHLALGLARHAAAQKARKGVADKGEKPESVDVALEKMNEGKRETIGNKLACPGPHDSVDEWDNSVKGAVRRANLRFKDGRAYSWVSLGLYAVMAEEGAVRRMNGTADAC